MEVYFLDVGQGSCHVALIGEQRAIVIDSGPSTGRVLTQILQRYAVQRIEVLATTHSHADHSGGSIEILATYAGQIGKIALLHDPSLFASAYWHRLRELIDADEIALNQLTRVEAADQPQQLFCDTTVRLKVE